MGAAGRLGLPASGYLFGTYENAANSGDGYAMAYHAGAELANLECFQINPLIKDYNGPACAYVAGPFGGYTANNEGERFIECDYWSGQMMLEFYNELQSGKGPVFLQAQPSRTRDHLARSRPSCTRSSGRRAACSSRARGRLPHRIDRDAHLRDRLLLRPQRLRRVRRRARAHDGARSLRRRRHGERAAQLHARRLHQRLGRRHRRDGVRRQTTTSPSSTRPMSRSERDRVLAPTRREDGIPPNQIEYKTRRLVNDYLQPPKVTRKFELGQRRLAEVRAGHAGAHDRAQRARADARARSAVDHRLRRHGGRSLALPRPRAAGASITCAHGFPGEGQRELVLPHAA